MSGGCNLCTSCKERSRTATERAEVEQPDGTEEVKSGGNKGAEGAALAISLPPAKQRDRTTTTKREDEGRTLDASVKKQSRTNERGARSLSVFDNDVGTGSISPLIVTGGKNGDVGLHDFRYIATGRSKRHRQPGDQDLKSATFLNTSNQVDNANGMIWYIPKAHLGSITRITTIPNTSMFLTGSKDGDVKLWDAKRAQMVFHWQRIHDRHTFIQPNSRTIGGVVRAAVTDIQVFSCGFLTCGGDGSVKLVQLK